MKTKEQFLLECAEKWNTQKLHELEVFEYMQTIRDNYQMGLISVEEFTEQNITLLNNLKNNLL